MRAFKVMGLVALCAGGSFLAGCGSGGPGVAGDFPVLAAQQLVSMRYDSYDICDAFSKDPVLNYDGRFVAYASKGSDVIADDQTVACDYNDVFRFDRLIGQNVIVSVRPDGVQANCEEVGGCSHRGDPSDDAKLIVFQAQADNLITRIDPSSGEVIDDLDQNGECDIFCKNVETGALECISLPAALDGYAAQGASRPTISGDGRYVCFESGYDFTEYKIFGDDCAKEIWVYDRLNKTYEIVSRDNDGNPIAHYYSYACLRADISADGRYVAFETEASIDPRDTNGCQDIYRYDRLTQRLVLLSVSVDGTAAGVNEGTSDEGSHQPKLSADGRYVAFKSLAANLIESDANDVSDVFVRDIDSGVTVCCSRGYGDVDAIDDGSSGTGVSQRPSISADGRYVAFDSATTNLVAEEDTNGRRDVYVFDRVTGQTRRVPNHPLLNEDPEAPLEYTCQHHPSISGDGRFVAFMRAEGGSRFPYAIIMVAPNPFVGGESDETTPLPPMIAAPAATPVAPPSVE